MLTRSFQAKAPAPPRCTHENSELREQVYPHGWRCNGCGRFFFGSVTDAIPQTLPPGDRERARLHNERKARVAAEMAAEGLTPPEVSR